MIKENNLFYKELHISKITSVHYYESLTDFNMTDKLGKSWQFIYIDKGDASVTLSNIAHKLKKGQIIFISPGETYTLEVDVDHYAHIISAVFECTSSVVHFFKNKILDITKIEQNLLIMFVCEARKCIALPLDDPMINKMDKYNDDVFGSKQLLYIYLEEFLLYIIRRSITQPYITPLSNTSSNSMLYNKILRYMEAHICEPLSIDDICQNNLVSRSQLQKIFQKEHQCGVIDFFSQMKIEFAKQLIRDSQLNLTQISSYLGYSSIHYFSRQFKKITGITPSAYAVECKK